MSDHPYTAPQVSQLAKAINGSDGAGSYITAGHLLADLHRAGITVTFPEPRFYIGWVGRDAGSIKRGETTGAWVYDRERTEGQGVAYFTGTGHATYAHAHLNRLIAGARS